MDLRGKQKWAAPKKIRKEASDQPWAFTVIYIIYMKPSNAVPLITTSSGSPHNLRQPNEHLSSLDFSRSHLMAIEMNHHLFLFHNTIMYSRANVLGNPGYQLWLHYVETNHNHLRSITSNSNLGFIYTSVHCLYMGPPSAGGSCEWNPRRSQFLTTDMPPGVVNRKMPCVLLVRESRKLQRENATLMVLMQQRWARFC